MKKPKVIYLQTEVDGDTTWAEDPISLADTKYIRADLQEKYAEEARIKAEAKVSSTLEKDKNRIKKTTNTLWLKIKDYKVVMVQIEVFTKMLLKENRTTSTELAKYFKGKLNNHKETK